MEGVSVAGCGGGAGGRGVAGVFGNHRVLSGDIFMYCRGMFWSATTKPNISRSSHQGMKRKEREWGQCISSMQEQVQSHCTQTATITSLSEKQIRAPPLRQRPGSPRFKLKQARIGFCTKTFHTYKVCSHLLNQQTSYCYFFPLRRKNTFINICSCPEVTLWGQKRSLRFYCSILDLFERSKLYLTQWWKYLYRGNNKLHSTFRIYEAARVGAKLNWPSVLFIGLYEPANCTGVIHILRCLVTEPCMDVAELN